ncbi:hypothetical protein L873DRAFT_1794949 [Choiromyces venosus 120613-1]|uniref:Uncharacterized protein n=1 Tax=Choiromyces venosus 120613-1 TaxID=1336337 RepID=A0A3N4IZQ3_9PEZI|nr:hypothetical protein L873DRAFT_1794949 [Choiromyces venosus 120613-1]
MPSRIKDFQQRLGQLNLTMSVNILVGASQTCASDWATMSHSDITIQSSNFMPDNTNGDSGGGGGGSGGDTTIMPSGSAADLTNKLRINMSKMKEDERSAACRWLSWRRE